MQRAHQLNYTAGEAPLYPAARFQEVTDAKLSATSVFARSPVEFVSTMGNNKLQRRCDVPECMHMPHIQTGYRPTPSTAMYCVKSAFRWTNETINFWTHFIPFLLMLRKTFIVVVNNQWELINYPLYIYLLGASFVLLVSSMAHLFNSCSTRCYYCCFSSDYGAVLMYGVTFQTAIEHYVCPVRCFGLLQGQTTEVYLRMSLYYCTVQIISACLGYLPHISKLFRCVLYFFGMVIICTPCFVRYYLYGTQNETTQCWKMGQELSFLFYLHCVLICVGLTFYATKFPECMFPEKFDIVGSSHQFFHICVAAAMFVDAAMFESSLSEAKHFINNKVISEEYLQITWKTTFGHTITMFCITYFVVAVFNFVINYDKKSKLE